MKTLTISSSDLKPMVLGNSRYDIIKGNQKEIELPDKLLVETVNCLHETVSFEYEKDPEVIGKYIDVVSEYNKHCIYIYVLDI